MSRVNAELEREDLTLLLRKELGISRVSCKAYVNAWGCLHTSEHAVHPVLWAQRSQEHLKNYMVKNTVQHHGVALLLEKLHGKSSCSEKIHSAPRRGAAT
ncbi:MAG: hypothetical protein HRT89_13980 [Lentisphaeria bacterium]|nr:hypothetical protein [Lentisphaeria bacterium]